MVLAMTVNSLANIVLEALQMNVQAWNHHATQTIRSIRQ